MRIVWTAPARRDLFRIAEFYGQFDSELPLTLLRRVHDAAKILHDHPLIGAATGRPRIRKWSAKRTPFLLLYIAFSDRVEIRSVVDAHSDWRSLR